MIRVLLSVVAVTILSLTQVFAQTALPPAAPAVISVSPASGPTATDRTLQVANLAANANVSVTIIAPDGSESALSFQTGATGGATVPLLPLDAYSAPGLYRAVLPLADGNAVSAAFAVGDGSPRLVAQPYLTAPYSAFQLLGTGLPANQALDLVLSLANGRGNRHFTVTTDAAGNMEAYIWPQELSEPFLEAGLYHAAIPSVGVAADFTVWERPTESILTIDGQVQAGVLTPIHLRRYPGNRRVWLTYAGLNGVPVGEFLLGPTDAQGNLDTTVRFPTLPGGTYLLASPYDWGETGFTMLPPTVTPTASPTPTATPTPTAMPTPAPLFLRVGLAHRKVRAGRRQTIVVTTLPDAQLTIRILFPDHRTKHRAGTVNASGSYRWSFRQPVGVVTAKNTRAKVTVRVDDQVDPPLTASRSYRIT